MVLLDLTSCNKGVKKTAKMYSYLGKGGYNMNRKGFTLVEIMIVVAIIALLAAIAIPNLLRARLTANEAAAMAALKTLGSASHTYRSGHQGYPEDLTALTTDTPPYIDSVLAGGTKQGYAYNLTGESVDGNGNYQSFVAAACPVSFGNTGNRCFFIDSSGVITSNDGTTEASLADAYTDGPGWNPVE